MSIYAIADSSCMEQPHKNILAKRLRGYEVWSWFYILYNSSYCIIGKIFLPLTVPCYYRSKTFE